MTFAATANCVVFQGAAPVFADIEPDTLLISPAQIEDRISSRTKAIIAVDYTGHPADYDVIRSIADKHEIALVADACHALGASYKGRTVGSLADLSVFSFHPVKHITTGEGGMITTDDGKLAKKMRIFRNHGISSELREREQQGAWFYEMVELGYNYRLSDIQCALGIGQLKKLPEFLKRRREIAARYSQNLCSISAVEPLRVREGAQSAYHLYVVRVDFSQCGMERKDFFKGMQERGIRVNVHYIPVYLHPFYRRRFNTGPGLCPVAEQQYERIVSLPIYPAMQDTDIEKVISAVAEVLA
jgi:perosamine synthetase